MQKGVGLLAEPGLKLCHNRWGIVDTRPGWEKAEYWMGGKEAAGWYAAYQQQCEFERSGDIAPRGHPCHAYTGTKVVLQSLSGVGA